ncbi:Lysostaphin [Acaryochloris thomasi RCC1774]|uniref:Lysostaphin n=1 Tax=Acaryochloris thomasi RCC1774 TaxID=1764569 RepID=A0A2W1J704_9CYAN|nr:M23 family metallopeptidase [Acaryochloris thomasi]PZD70319.1 Lysostaphin [Acaryochloris thomasi RCC1774]
MLAKSFRNREKIRIGELMLQRGLINQSQLTQALAEQKQSGAQLGEICKQQGWVSQAQLQQVLNGQRRRNITRGKVRIGEVLMQRGLISQVQLTQALTEQKQNGLQLGDILVQRGWVSPTQLRQALYEQRRSNVITTVLLTATTLIPGATRLVSSTPVVAYGHEISQDEISLKLHYSDLSVSPPIVDPETEVDNPELKASYMDLMEIGGADIEGTSFKQARSSQEENRVEQPLHDKPTVSSPLQGFCHPLNGKGWLSQGIRGRTHRGRMEYAYDFAADIGTPVYAMRSGQVIAVRDKYPDTGGGKDRIAKFNYVLIEHDNGYRSAYIHLQQDFIDSIAIKAGDSVEAGQLIGFSGNSGWSTGPHLHLEVQRPGRRGRFTKTAPFSISGTCQDDQIAQN